MADGTIFYIYRQSVGDIAISGNSGSWGVSWFFHGSVLLDFERESFQHPGPVGHCDLFFSVLDGMVRV